MTKTPVVKVRDCWSPTGSPTCLLICGATTQGSRRVTAEEPIEKILTRFIARILIPFLAKKPLTGLNEKRWLVLIRPSPAGFGSTAYSHHIDEAFAA